MALQEVFSFLWKNWLEVAGVICGVLYLVLIIKENIWCWIFGILSSLITVFIYFETKLYLEAVLNVYYILAGLYGWYYWNRNKLKNTDSPPVVEYGIKAHLVNILLCTIITIGVGHLMDIYTDSPRPYIDTAMTVFGVSATVLEARKVLSAWIYWFVLNGCSIWLQVDRQLYFYAALSVFFTGMCIKGYIEWRKSYIAVRLPDQGNRLS